MTLLTLALLACSGSDDPEATSPADADTDTDADTDADNDGSLPEVEVVQLVTSDSVTLVGDYYGLGAAGGAGICLLHMIPPSNDRTGWPVSFIEGLRDAGWGVLAIDRRGAGDSGGVATAAYGPNGKYDTEACVGELASRGHDPVAVIGASNGTTAMIDYAVWAQDEPGAIPVAAMGFMTGGTYTESQTAMTEVPGVPAVFTYSVVERDWSVAQQGLHDDVWSFLEYPNGDHGTRMFQARPEVADDLVDFFADVL